MSTIEAVPRWVATLPAAFFFAIILYILNRIVITCLFAFALFPDSLAQFASEVVASSTTGFHFVFWSVKWNPKFKRETAIVFACILPFLSGYGIYLISEWSLARLVNLPLTLILINAGSILTAYYVNKDEFDSRG